MDMQKMGAYAFLVGVLISIVAGLIPSMVAGYAGPIGWLLLVLGLIVGLLNVTDKETVPFLVAAIALLATGNVTAWSNLDVAGIAIGTWIWNILGYVGVFVAPAAVVVALKAVYNLAAAK